MTSKDVKSIVRHMAVVLVELGRSAFLFALDSGIIAQVEGRIDNCNSMDETQEIAAELRLQIESVREGLASVSRTHPKCRHQAPRGLMHIGAMIFCKDLRSLQCKSRSSMPTAAIWQVWIHPEDRRSGY